MHEVDHGHRCVSSRLRPQRRVVGGMPSPLVAAPLRGRWRLDARLNTGARTSALKRCAEGRNTVIMAHSQVRRPSGPERRTQRRRPSDARARPAPERRPRNYAESAVWVRIAPEWSFHNIAEGEHRNRTAPEGGGKGGEEEAGKKRGGTRTPRIVWQGEDEQEQ